MDLEMIQSKRQKIILQFAVPSITAMVFTAMVIIGFGQGMVPIVSFTYGAEQRELAKKVRNTTICFVVIAALTVFVMMSCLAGWYSGLFSDSEEVLAMVKPGLRLQMSSFAFAGINTIVMNISDYEQVYQLWLSCAGMGLNNLDDSKEGIERFLNRNPETCFVAEIEQMIIGVIIAGNDGRRGYIYHTAVNPDYRHQGIATKLVNEAMGALKALGINKTALVVFSKNTDGNAFWEKSGFTSREDLIYRNKTITEMVRIDT